MLKNSEVTAIVFHFILSIAIVGAYVTTVILEKPDATLQNAALLVVGYWFGAVGGSKLATALKGKKPGGDA